MTLPTLDSLPPPPPGKSGWPWSEATPPLPPTQPSGVPWPRISIVTPSFNQGQFLEETLRSVLLQGYPNLDYLVIDGGSSDESRAIIERYAPWLSHWESEPDRGQAHAINKGLRRATGQLAAYLNSDDLYLPGALAHIGQQFARHPFDLFVGRRQHPAPRARWLRPGWWRRALQPFVYPFLFEPGCRYELPQECLFWNHARYGNQSLNEDYHFCLDVWWFVQLYADATVLHSTRPVGWFRVHPGSKSARLQALAEAEIAAIERASAAQPPIAPAAKRAILRAYRHATRRARLRALMGLPHTTFRYHHPPYRPPTVAG